MFYEKIIKSLIVLVFSFCMIILFTPNAHALYTNNLLKNPGFEDLVSGTSRPCRWRFFNLYTYRGDISVDNYKRFENRSFHIYGEPGRRKTVYQVIKVSGKAGDIIEFSGWAKALRADNPSGNFGLVIGIHYTDSTWKWASHRFNYGTHPFEFGEVEAKAKKSFDHIAVYCTFYNQPTNSHAWFDGLRVNKNPYFPRLMFRVNENDLSSSEFNDLGCSVVLQPRLGAQHDEAIRNYLNAIPKGVCMVFPLSARGAGWDGDKSYYIWLKDPSGYYYFNYDRAKEILEGYANHPKIGAWYLYDELTTGRVTISELKKAYQYVKSFSSKPVGVCFSQGQEFLNFDCGNGYCDFLLLDFYPFLSSRSGYPIIEDDRSDHCQIDRQWRKMNFGLTSNKPWYGVVQAFGKDGLSYREPSKEEILTQVREYKSLGAGGIAYFSYSHDDDNSDPRRPPYYHVYDKPEWQEAVRAANQEWLRDC